MQWVRSLDEMRALGAEHLVPSHTRPLSGSEAIQETLTDYRDAIQYVHDQTVRLMNQGLGQQEIVERVKLPGHLARKPFLQEHYGTVEWSVRAVFAGYLGWFSGNATELFPLSLKARAGKMADLAGGTAALRERARESFDRGEFQWCLELTDHLLSLDRGDDAAMKLRSACLRRLGLECDTATARNYYLASSGEAAGAIVIADRKNTERDVVRAIPLEAIFRGMAVKLDPEKSRDVSRAVAFNFPDCGEAWTVTVHRGVARISNGADSRAAISLIVDSSVWKEIAAGMRNPAAALAGGDIRVRGGTFDLARFLWLFR
jgi:alkyl sulfatase BDS1-like metallo-beta-lactamase superfamily hydrolase